MTGLEHDYWTIEHDWVAPHSQSSQLKGEPLTIPFVLSVVFDSGAQRQFSSVRLTLLLSNDVASTSLHNLWNITPCPPESSPRVVDHVTAQDIPPPHNDPSLPICHIVFTADRCDPSDETKYLGKLVLTEPGSVSSSSVQLFEFSRPLTEITQTVSFSFTSRHVLSTEIPCGDVSSRHFFMYPPATVCRVVRVVPTSKHEHRTIPLPTEVLLFIFENLRIPLRYQGWRQDLLNCALVCRGWTCALELLLLDFRSAESQRYHRNPPELIGLAKALNARPSLGLGIKYLSMSYWMKHPTWKSSLDIYEPRRVPREQFLSAFLSILRVAKNVQNLSLDSGIALSFSPDDLVDALSGLSKLETLMELFPLTVSELLSCIAPCPWLKSLFIGHAIHSSTRAVPLKSLPSPSFHLTSLKLEDVPIEDDEFAYIANACRSTLSQLTLKDVWCLTNAGLTVALTTVSASLTYLYLRYVDLDVGYSEGEEYALDVTIARMGGLTELKIVGDCASERMVRRRAEAVVATRMPLPEVHLHLTLSRYNTEAQIGLAAAVERDWPGWRFTVYPSDD